MRTDQCGILQQPPVGPHDLIPIECQMSRRAATSPCLIDCGWRLSIEITEFQRLVALGRDFGPIHLKRFPYCFR